MRALDRLISFIFSIVMLILSIVLILIGIGVVNPQMVIDMLNEHVFVSEMIEAKIFNPLTITGIVILLASLKTTVFLSLFKVKDKAPILVKTQNGEVEIAQETITSTVKNVGLSFENIKDVQAKMIKKGKGVVIYAMVLVYAETNIRETTEEMQRQVKEIIKATTGVNVIEVNIKVKNIYQKQKKNDVVKENKDLPKENNETPMDQKVEEIPMELNQTEIIENEEIIDTNDNNAEIPGQEEIREEK